MDYHVTRFEMTSPDMLAVRIELPLPDGKTIQREAVVPIFLDKTLREHFAAAWEYVGQALVDAREEILRAGGRSAAPVLKVSAHVAPTPTPPESLDTDPSGVQR